MAVTTGIKIATTVAKAIATKVAEADRTARLISIWEIKGADVTMTKGADKSFKAQAGFGLADGYTITTGKNSYCWLDLDQKIILKIDQNSKIQIGKTPLKKLLVSVLKGSITKDPGPQRAEGTSSVKAGNSALGILG